MQIKFEWTPEMSVNDETIDSQHRELLKQINILLDVIFEEKEINTLRETVDFLSKYIKNHLKFGEELDKPPLVFATNYFLQENGKFLI